MKFIVTKKELIDMGFSFAKFPVYDNEEMFVIQQIEGYEDPTFTIYNYKNCNDVFNPDQIDGRYLLSELKKHIIKNGE